MLNTAHTSLRVLSQSDQASVWQLSPLVAYGSVGLFMYCIALAQTHKIPSQLLPAPHPVVNSLDPL